MGSGSALQPRDPPDEILGHPKSLVHHWLIIDGQADGNPHEMKRETSKPGPWRWRGLIGLAAGMACAQAFLAGAGKGAWSLDPQRLIFIFSLGLAAAGAATLLGGRKPAPAVGVSDLDPGPWAGRAELALRRILVRFRRAPGEAWYRWALKAPFRDQALGYLEESARLGHVDAHFELGLFYEEGGMGQAGREVAARHYRSAAEAGSAEAAYRLAELLRWGIGPARDPGAAHRWYLRSAHDGFRPAMDWLARAYEFGEGIAEDLEKAVYWTVKARAAEKVDLRISHFARSRPRAVEPAVRREISRGWEDSMGPLGDPGDFRTAAKRGEPQACFHMGMSFLCGDEGLPRDPGAARIWLQRAAEGGHVEAMAELGDLLAGGPQAGDARIWFQRAGAAGHQGAQIRLGQLEVPDS